MQIDTLSDIEIIKISPSTNPDRSRYYLLDIVIKIKKWECSHSEYLDPMSNKIVINHIRPDKNKGITGNQRARILSEISVRLNLSDNDTKIKFNELLSHVNSLIETSLAQNYRSIFPPFEDILSRAFNAGFMLIQYQPEYHFMQTILTQRGDVELHICTSSIDEVLDELESFETSGYVSTSYSYRGIVKRCAWQSAFYTSVNQEGNGWYLHCRGDEIWEKKSRRLNSLRDLYFAMLDCKQELAVGP